LKLRSRYFKTSNYNDTKQQSFANVYYTEAQIQKRFEKLRATFTMGGAVNDGDVTSDLYGYHENVNRSFYAQLDKKFIDKLNISLGVRNETFKFTYQNTETKPVFRTGINYEITPGSNVRASYGQGYRYPSIAEKYIRTNVGQINIYPNDSIKPETGWTMELGYKQIIVVNAWKAYFDFAMFKSRYSNMMEFSFGRWGKLFVDPFFGLGFKSENIGNTQINGFEISSGGEGKAGNIPLTFLIDYTYIDPYQRDYIDTVAKKISTADYNVLKYRYRHLFKADVCVSIKKFDAGADILYNSFMENIDAVFNQLIPGVKHYRDKHQTGDWVFDARVAFNVDKNFKVALISKNIFNRLYAGRPADMQPTRRFVLQMSLGF
jgi:iron complex outermembrane receptor protein